MMAFFATMPINRIIPMEATSESSLQASNANSAPNPSVGTVERMVSGWIWLS